MTGPGGMDAVTDDVRRMEALLARHPRVSWLTPREAAVMLGYETGEHVTVWTRDGQVLVQGHVSLRLVADALEAVERAGGLPGQPRPDVRPCDGPG